MGILYLFLPAFVANSMPVIARVVPGIKHWTTPIAPRLFGANKTYRGFAMGVGAAVLCALLQYVLLQAWTWNWPEAAELYGTPARAILTGLLLGGGALCGDLAKSFCKRRVGIAPGRAWPVLDGIDYMVGAIIFALPLYTVSLSQAAILLVAGPILSLAANICSYVLGWKNVWY